MSRKSPFQIVLTHTERQVLLERARCYTLPYFLVVRAKAILMAASGLSNDEIAHRLSLGRDVVSQWRARFYRERLDGLQDRPRKGRPRIRCTSESG